MEMYQDNRRDVGDGPARTSQKQQKQQQQQQQQQQQGGMYGTGGVAKTTIGAPKLISTKLNETKAEGEIPTVFLAKLMKSGFNTKEYLMSTLEHVSEKNIRIFRKSLEDSKKVAARNLQKSIYTNYKEFIVIGKEIMRLEKEARMVQQMMEKMEALGVGVYGGGEGEEGEELSESEKQAAKVLRRKTVRMVGQGQEEMVEKYVAQMSKLFNTVDGAQRMLPYSAGRHIVGVVKKMEELSPVSFRTRQAVQVVVLNDALLFVAMRKRAEFANPVLVADKCMRLNELTVVQVDDTSQVVNGVKLLNRAETYLYRFPTSNSKKEFLDLVEKAITNSGGLVLTAFQVAGDTDGGRSGKKEFQEMYSVVEKTCLKLDVHIIRRELDAGVYLMEELKRMVAEFSSEMQRDAEAKRIGEEVRIREEELARMITGDLATACMGKREIGAKICLLVRIGWRREAKEAFLQGRSATIRHRTRQLSMEGSIRTYIRELAVVSFRLIRNTCDWYSEFIDDVEMTSALIAWVRSEMARYASIFRRQVFHSLQEFQVIASCIQYTLDEVEVLGNAGLDLRFMLEQEFFGDLTHCIELYERRAINVMIKTISDDSFDVIAHVPLNDSSKRTTRLRTMFGETPGVPLVKSIVRLDETLCEFAQELMYIAKDSLYGQAVSSISAIIENILKQFLISLRKGSREKDRDQMSSMSIRKALVILVSTQVTISWIIPKCAKTLDSVFNRTVTDIYNLETRLEGFPSTLHEVFCQRTALALATNHLIDGGLNLPMSQQVAAKKHHPKQTGSPIDLYAHLSRSTSTYYKPTKSAADKRSSGGAGGKNASTNIIDVENDYIPQGSYLTPTDNINELIGQLSTIKSLLTSVDDYKCLPTSTLLTGLIDHMFYNLVEEKHWPSMNAPNPAFGYIAVHQLVLDIHYFLKVCSKYISKNANKLANKYCEKALRLYFVISSSPSTTTSTTTTTTTTTKDELGNPNITGGSGNPNKNKSKEMKGKSWYDECVEKSLSFSL